MRSKFQRRRCGAASLRGVLWIDRLVRIAFLLLRRRKAKPLDDAIYNRVILKDDG
jgi:hypothetical protein